MGKLNFQPSSLVYVDTQIIIYSVEKFPNYFPALEPMWFKLKAGEIKLITSELALLETLVMPLKQADVTLVQTYEQLLLGTDIQLIPISQKILRDAATLRATVNLKTPDAIHATTTLSANCTSFLTNDRAFRNVSNLSAAILDDVIASP
ncbi:MAG: type II toxin-antitoxin system VapC family toxin [Leptolyngbyaceae cyanobacterium SL_5_14]|nr:type II toxin-antitoxin system VapC family toxin [Leptolyngbyaceae cyanobacterium SL_5_14]